MIRRSTGVFLSIWVVYDNPADMPGYFVARRHDMIDGGSVPTAIHFAAGTLDEVRELLPPCLTCLPRFEGDEPHIVEVWL